jgi:hypothetical protein
MDDSSVIQRSLRLNQSLGPVCYQQLLEEHQESTTRGVSEEDLRRAPSSSEDWSRVQGDQQGSFNPERRRQTSSALNQSDLGRPSLPNLQVTVQQSPLGKKNATYSQKRQISQRVRLRVL